MAMPCRHIFFVRQHLGMSDFEISMVADRWKKSYQILPEIATENEPSNTDFEFDVNEGKSIEIHKLSSAKPVLKGTLSQSQKYTKMINNCKRLATIASQCGMPEFREKYAQIETIFDFWSTNTPCHIQRVCYAS